MPRTRLSDATATLHEGFARIRSELGVEVEFPPEVLRAASEARATGDDERVDRRDLPFVSIDPYGSRDLDQAFHLATRPGGYRFHYAIADVAAWVLPGGPLDAAAWARGATIYCPDVRAPLHPTVLSEGSASLLAGVERPAVLWTIDLDDAGATTDIAVERATVRNLAALDYVSAQAHLDDGVEVGPLVAEQLRLLAEIGRLRQRREAARGGVSLSLPDQVVVADGGRYGIEYRTNLETEAWNAQLSLCCGIAAARLMLSGGVGVLRTLPPADADTLASLRATSIRLGVPWPETLTYPEWVRTLDPSTPHGIALMTSAARTLRGAGYAAFDGAAPASPEHHAIAAPYAHVTAPLRRLVDRFGTECALAVSRGGRPPGWALEALGRIAEVMDRTASHASAVDRACVDLVEAAVLQHRVGDELDGVVTTTRNDRVVVQLVEPAVIAEASPAAGVAPGDRVRVRVISADTSTRTVCFAISGGALRP